MLYNSKVKASGKYTVQTNTKSGESKVEVEIRMKVDSKPDFNSMFGIYWGIGYAKKRTETYMAAWRGHGRKWVHKSWKRKQTVATARSDVYRGLNKPDEQNTVWKAIGTPKIDGNTITLRAWRNFDVKDSSKNVFWKNKERDFFLHSNKTWFVGYFNTQKQMTISSELMTMSLESGYRKPN